MFAAEVHYNIHDCVVAIDLNEDKSVYHGGGKRSGQKRSSQKRSSQKRSNQKGSSKKEAMPEKEEQ